MCFMKRELIIWVYFKTSEKMELKFTLMKQKYWDFDLSKKIYPKWHPISLSFSFKNNANTWLSSLHINSIVQHDIYLPFEIISLIKYFHLVK